MFSSFLPILRAAVPLARSSFSITMNEKRTRVRAVYWSTIFLPLIPLRVRGATGDRFEDVDFVKRSVEKVEQAHAERREQVKRLAHKMTT